MSESVTKKKSLIGKVGMTLFLIAIGGITIPSIIDHYYPKSEAGVRVITDDADNMVDEHATGVQQRLDQTSYKREDNTVDLGLYTETRRPEAHEVAVASLKRREMIAEAKGETLPQPPRYLHGYQHTWMATRIPIYSCTRISAAGEIVRDPYTKAGPNGIDVAAMTEQVHKMFLDVHGDKTTLLKTVPWGTFLGKVCRDAQGSQCGVQFPIGENAYLSPDQVGAGQLWVVANGFVSHQTGASLLSGLPFPNLGDYNVYQGGYSFDQEPAQDYRCESITKVAQR